MLALGVADFENGLSTICSSDVQNSLEVVESMLPVAILALELAMRVEWGVKGVVVAKKRAL